MTNLRTCERCRHWFKWVKPGGECRRNAPICSVVHDSIDDTEYTAYWPGTDGSDWCGDWKAKS